MGNYVIGLDYGTDSVRAILVDTSDGKTLNSKVHLYINVVQSNAKKI